MAGKRLGGVGGVVMVVVKREGGRGTVSSMVVVVGLMSWQYVGDVATCFVIT
jgi:hypothetical protein